MIGSADWLLFIQELEGQPELTRPQRIIFESKVWRDNAHLIINRTPRLRPARFPCVMRVKSMCPQCKVRKLTFECSVDYMSIPKTFARPAYHYTTPTCDCGAEVKLEPLMDGGYVVVLIGVKSTHDKLRSGDITDGIVFNEFFDIKRHVDTLLIRMLLVKLTTEEQVEWSEERTRRVLSSVNQGQSLIDAYEDEVILYGTGRTYKSAIKGIVNKGESEHGHHSS